MINTVINYCTTDKRFIQRNIEECLKFSDKVIVPICDHFFDGTLENYALIEDHVNLFAKEPRIYFLQYQWDHNKNAKFHHNMSRWIGLQFTESDYVLFLDADEILEGDVVKQYLQSDEYKKYHVMSFRCYWYFREPIHQAIPTEMAGVLYKRDICNEQMIFHQQERWAYRDYIRYLDIQEDITYNNIVMCHHYSWVRTKEEMLKKISAWAHSTDTPTGDGTTTNWIQLVENEFSGPFKGKDFIHNYTFQTVENKLDTGDRL